jgi:hypothetical protein
MAVVSSQSHTCPARPHCRPKSCSEAKVWPAPRPSAESCASPRVSWLRHLPPVQRPVTAGAPFALSMPAISTRRRSFREPKVQFVSVFGSGALKREVGHDKEPSRFFGSFSICAPSAFMVETDAGGPARQICDNGRRCADSTQKLSALLSFRMVRHNQNRNRELA